MNGRVIPNIPWKEYFSDFLPPLRSQINIFD